MATEHFDVMIVGAGLSGVGAACHLQADCPDRSYVILEGRDAIGGTPVANIQDAFVRGNAGMQKYCVDQDIPCESFYVKDTIQEGEAWVLQFFGNPRNQGMYVNVRVYPDGRAEVER